MEKRIPSIVWLMTEQPTLKTDRLVLRPFGMDDAREVQRLAGDHAIAATTLRIPHPYPDGCAAEWIASLQPAFASGASVAFAITRASDGALLGAIGLDITREHERAELGYWIGKPYWGNGYCTEAARAIVDYAFDDLGLNRVGAVHFAHNNASGRVMQNIGMTCEGHRIQEIKKCGKFEDLILYGLVRARRA
jgi:RimJ/RimL family protein N-acetyltransferase